MYNHKKEYFSNKMTESSMRKETLEKLNKVMDIIDKRGSNVFDDESIKEVTTSVPISLSTIKRYMNLKYGERLDIMTPEEIVNSLNSLIREWEPDYGPDFREFRVSDGKVCEVIDTIIIEGIREDI